MINEHKKGVKAMKYTTKPKNPVAKAHQTIGSGSGEHKDKKKAAKQVRGQKHKSAEIAEFAALAPIAGAVARTAGRAAVGGIAKAVANKFSNDEQKENAEYDDEAGMADNNLETLERAVQGIDELIDTGDNLPEWCQEKIAVAKSMLVAVWDYMKSEENTGQGVAEGYSTLDLWNMSPKEVIELLDAKKITWDEYRAYRDLVIAGGPDEEDDFDYTDYTMRKGERGMAEVAGPEKCWPGHRKVGTKPGTGKNAGKRVNDCEKIKESNWYEVRLQTLLETKLKK